MSKERSSRKYVAPPINPSHKRHLAGTVRYKITANRAEFPKLMGMLTGLQFDGAPHLKTGGTVVIVVTTSLLAISCRLEAHGQFIGLRPTPAMLAKPPRSPASNRTNRRR